MSAVTVSWDTREDVAVLVGGRVVLTASNAPSEWPAEPPVGPATVAAVVVEDLCRALGVTVVRDAAVAS